MHIARGKCVNNSSFFYFLTSSHLHCHVFTLIPFLIIWVLVPMTTHTQPFIFTSTPTIYHQFCYLKPNSVLLIFFSFYSRSSLFQSFSYLISFLLPLFWSSFRSRGVEININSQALGAVTTSSTSSLVGVWCLRSVPKGKCRGVFSNLSTLLPLKRCVHWKITPFFLFLSFHFFSLFSFCLFASFFFCFLSSYLFPFMSSCFFFSVSSFYWSSFSPSFPSAL